MKVRSVLLPLVSVALVLAACSAGLGGTASPSPTIPAEYIAGYFPVAPVMELPGVEMTVPLPAMTEKATAYRIEYPSIDAGYAIEAAKKFDVVGELRQGEDLFTVVDADTGNYVEVYKTGAMSFSLSPDAYTRLLLNDEAQLPSTQDAEQIAVRFLEEKGLLPPEARSFIESDLDGLSLHRVRVDFRYRIGAYLGEGPGYWYSVIIGDGVKVAAASIFYPRFVPHTEVSLRTTQEALQDLVTGKGSWMECQGVKAVLDQVSLRYYLQPATARQEFVLPVYVFEGKAIDADGKVVGRAAALATAVRVP